MKKKKFTKQSTAFEFFYDDSFEDYQVKKDSTLKANLKDELSFIKERFNWKYYLKFLFGCNFGFYLLISSDNLMIKFTLINVFCFFFLIYSYLKAKNLIPDTDED